MVHWSQHCRRVVAASCVVLTSVVLTAMTCTMIRLLDFCWMRNRIKRVVLTSTVILIAIGTVATCISRQQGHVFTWRFIPDLFRVRQTSLTCSVDKHNFSSLLGPTQEDDLRKIESYRFDGIQEYIDDLFPTRTTPQQPEKFPTLVSGFSSNHFEEGTEMVSNLQETILKKYKHLKFIIFDLGLTKQQVQQLKSTCSCEIRTFPFEKFPVHVWNLGNYVWKPLIIQSLRDARLIKWKKTPETRLSCTDGQLGRTTDLPQASRKAAYAFMNDAQNKMIVREHPFMFWMDASVRFKTDFLDELFAQVQEVGMMASDSGHQVASTITSRTLQSTFSFLQEDPCAFATEGEKQGGLVLLYASPFISKYFLRPWVSCALTVGCMDPGELSYRVIDCPMNTEPLRYQLCHRFDQSVLGILYVRLFHRDLRKHGVNPKYFHFCKDGICYG